MVLEKSGITVPLFVGNRYSCYVVLLQNSAEFGMQVQFFFKKSCNCGRLSWFFCIFLYFGGATSARTKLQVRIHSKFTFKT